MELTKDVLKELALPFPANRISIKVQTKPNDNGNALCVAYIDARDVMERLDNVVGGNWSDDYRLAPSGGLECALTIYGVTRRDVGDDESDNEQKKAAYSDAFKRAAVKFGIGRFLYDLPKMYGKVKQIGKNFYLADGEEERLQKIVFASLSGKPLPATPQKPETKPAEMTIERAKVVRDSKGELYCEKTKDELLHIIDTPAAPEDKKAAAKLLLASGLYVENKEGK